LSDPQPPALKSRSFAVAVVIGLTLFSGVVHGFLDGRWENPTDLRAQGDLLGKLPSRCGDWVLVKSMPLDQGAADLLRCHGSEVRVYRNEVTDVLVNVAVFFGPRGPIAVHTPEVCYSSAGTKQTREKMVETIETPGGSHQLWSVQFRKDLETEPSLEVWYAWSDGDEFEAAANPRFWMVDNLYKIQVAGPVGLRSESYCQDFVKSFLPKLQPLMR